MISKKFLICPKFMSNKVDRNVLFDKPISFRINFYLHLKRAWNKKEIGCNCFSRVTDGLEELLNLSKALLSRFCFFVRSCFRISIGTEKGI